MRRHTRHLLGYLPGYAISGAMYVAGAALISLLGCWLEQRPVGLFGQHGAMWLLLALCMPVVFAVADLLIHWRDGSQIRWRGGSR